jgi:hypothetical protein
MQNQVDMNSIRNHNDLREKTILNVGEAKRKIETLLTVLRNPNSPGLFLWGAPGIGKSAIIKEIAEEQNLQFRDLRLSLLDPVDLRGIPTIDRENEQAKWLPPDFLPHPKDPPGILFLDELNAAPPIVQASAYQLILDKQLGNYKLPPNWVIIAAGNREDDRSVTFTMPSALANRFLHLDLKCDINDWKEWAYKNEIHESVIGFLSYKPTYLFDFKPTSEQRAFATPRTWAFLSNIVKDAKSARDVFFFAPGLIGYSISLEFLAFYKLHEQIPKMEPILEGQKTDVPPNLSVMYLLVGGLLSRYKADPKKEYQQNLVNYMQQIPVEFAILIARDLVKIDPTVMLNTDFVNWTTRNREAFSMA